MSPSTFWSGRVGSRPDRHGASGDAMRLFEDLPPISGELESAFPIAGDEILIECESTIGLVDLQDDAVIDALMDALDSGGAVKLCVEPRVGKYQDRIFVRRELLFDPDATQLADVLAMFENTLSPAVRLHAVLEDIGLIDQPIESVHRKELRFYLETLARECDRLEYILTGADLR